MNLEQCYAAFGGDYAETLLRLGKESLVMKLLKRFLQDDSMEKLAQALSASDVQTAFTCAHTLKGVALNLGFSALSASSAALTEQLRSGSSDDAAELFAAVQADYLQVRNAICKTQLD